MSISPLDFEQWLQLRVSETDAVLDALLPSAAQKPERLHEAMRYAVLGGGKRVRASLVYAAGEAAMQGKPMAAAQEKALGLAAAAVELIHAYSLVHDDLPCMDDDELRRGLPTVHVQYGEACAMLTGDALQPLAFSALAQMPIAPALVVQAMGLLARAAGSLGMAGGQAIDCDSVGKSLSQAELQVMHGLKTGAMLEASILIGGIVAGASSSVREGLQQYADAVGLAFQVADDILDVTADTQTLGKTAGKDAADNKPTYVSIMGLEGSQKLLRELAQNAALAIRPLGASGTRLKQLAEYIVDRDR